MLVNGEQIGKIYIIFTRRGIDIDQYPAIKAYLAQYRDRLEPKPADWPTGKKWHWRRAEYLYQWYEIQDSTAYYEELSKPKIVYQKFQVEPKFTFDELGAFVNSAIWMLVTDDLALMAILNSRVGWFLITQYCTKIQRGYQLIWDYFKRIPIPNPNVEQRRELESIVRQLLTINGQGPQVVAWERELNEIVYRLYDLTGEEIALIETAFPLAKRRRKWRRRRRRYHSGFSQE